MIPLIRLAAFVSLGCLAAAGAARAAEPVDIEQLVADALAHNPELKFYEAEIALARGQQRVSASWDNPELSAELGRKSVRDFAGNRLGDGAIWSVSLSQRVEFPGRLALRKAIADRQVELAELGLEQFRTALANEVRLLGYQLLAARQRSDAAQEVAKRFQDLLDVLVQRDPAGIAPLLDTRIIEANALSLARRARQAVEEHHHALTRLNQLRGAPNHAPISIAPREIRLGPLPELAELHALARTRNFALRARTAELEQQGFHVQLARNERWPAITLTPYVAGEHASDRQREFGLGVSVPLPLRQRQRGSEAAAEARRAQAEVALTVALRDVERAVEENVHAYLAQQEEIARWRDDSVGRFREAAELGDQHYRLGALSISTYTELQKQYLDALDALLGTQADALATRAALEQLTGADLSTVADPAEPRPPVATAHPMHP